jgi:hypothetical protein
MEVMRTMVWIALAAAAAGPWLHDAKDFVAQQGHTNLSQEELAKLYAQFLEWSRRAKN